MLGNWDAGAGRPAARDADGGEASPAEVVRCVSRDNRRKYCAADTSNGMHMLRQLSSAECIQGSTWGYDLRGVWVVSGCGGEFIAAMEPQSGEGGAGAADADADAGPVGEQIVRCESRGHRRSRCNAVVGEGVELIRQLSRTRCVQRQNWGWDRRGIWVGGNCGAEFRVY
ncbi:DUF3011 domain-containing protein [Luteimonas sp. A277]